VKIDPAASDSCQPGVYCTVSWKLRECERLLTESATVTVMFWTPFGVPGFVVVGLLGEEELQLTSGSRPAARNKVRRLARTKRYLNLRNRRGEKGRRIRLTNAIARNGSSVRNRARGSGVVVRVSLVVAAAPLAKVTVAGEKVQDDSAGRFPQENVTVPL